MKITLNQVSINNIVEDAILALVDTGETVKTDLIQTQKMPFQKGVLQNDSTFVDDKNAINGVIRIVSDTPYARKLYFHPEYNFDKSKNPNASGRWFDPYINGEKKKLMQKYFKMNLKRRLGI